MPAPPPESEPAMVSAIRALILLALRGSRAGLAPSNVAGLAPPSTRVGLETVRGAPSARRAPPPTLSSLRRHYPVQVPTVGGSPATLSAWPALPGKDSPSSRARIRLQSQSRLRVRRVSNEGSQ